MRFSWEPCHGFHVASKYAFVALRYRLPVESASAHVLLRADDAEARQGAAQDRRSAVAQLITNDQSPNEQPPNDQSPNDQSPNEQSPNEQSPNEKVDSNGNATELFLASNRVQALVRDFLYRVTLKVRRKCAQPDGKTLAHTTSICS